MEGNNSLYDFNTLQRLLKLDRSKLQRDLKRINGTSYVKYKNLHLYSKETLFLLMEEKLIGKLKIIDLQENELSKNTGD